MSYQYDQKKVINDNKRDTDKKSTKDKKGVTHSWTEVTRAGHQRSSSVGPPTRSTSNHPEMDVRWRPGDESPHRRTSSRQVRDRSHSGDRAPQ